MHSLYTRQFLLSPLLFILMDHLADFLNYSVRSEIRRDKAQMRLELNSIPQDVHEFEFIIVGSGSAGSALASRLSEKYEVLLLELGGCPSLLLDVPAYAFYSSTYDAVDIGHKTVPQKYAGFGLYNNVSHWPAGKQLGGSSAISTLTYTRGNVQGFQDMSVQLGDGRWATDNILKHFDDLENYHGWYDNEGEGSHGKTGQMHIEKSHVSPFVYNLLDGGIELGYPVRDPNHGAQNTEGFAYVDSHMKLGKRRDAFREFLGDKSDNCGGTMKKSNLTVKKFSTVTKVNFRAGTKTADGVTYQRHGRKFTAKATKEVILCAGALGTAKLLMLSGIGPKDDLEKLGIHNVANLPVGQSLQDMYGVLVGPFVVKNGYSFRRDRDITIQSVAEWTLHGTGPIASSKIEATYDIISNYSKSQGNFNKPDLHVEVIAASADSTLRYEDLERSYNLNSESLDFFKHTLGKDSFLQMVFLHSPKQTGYVKLRDANPKTSLEINPKYLEKTEDLKVLVDGLRFAIKVAESTNSMRDINGRLLRIPFPGCESHNFTNDFISDEYLECLARHATVSSSRYCGTAPIEFKGNPTQVVRSDFRVEGFKNLRVVDASVLQLKYVSVTDATVRMLGILASEIIGGFWHNPSQEDEEWFDWI